MGICHGQHVLKLPVDSCGRAGTEKQVSALQLPQCKQAELCLSNLFGFIIKKQKTVFCKTGI